MSVIPKIAVLLLTGVVLAGCASAPVDRPCGVITDSLIDVNATTPEGQRRIHIHHARGRAAGCWR